MPTLPDLLQATVELGASDLHITTRSAPQVRVDGLLRPLDLPPLGAAETKQLAYSVLSDAQKKRFEETFELDFSFGVQNLSRFRGNVYKQRGCVAMAIRQIPYEIVPLAKLGMPPILGKLAELPRGLVLVTGPTGSGKSTTLAAMVDKVNRERKGHIITIEDPVEYVFEDNNCIIEQREVGLDTPSYQHSLKHVMRQDPDVIMVGEMRDKETCEIGIEASLTGHLVLSTLHTNSAPETIVRLLDMGMDPFNFADALLCILAQRLFRTLCKKCKEPYNPKEDEYQDLVTEYGPEHFEKTGIEYSSDLTL